MKLTLTASVGVCSMERSAPGNKKKKKVARLVCNVIMELVELHHSLISSSGTRAT